MHLAGVVLRGRIIASAVILARLRRLGKGVARQTDPKGRTERGLRAHSNRLCANRRSG